MEISIKHKGETLQEIKQGRVYSLTSLLKTHSLCLIILHRIWSYSIKWCLYFPLHAHKVRHYSCPWSKIKLLMSICLSLTTTHTHTAVMSAKEHIFIFKDFPRSWSPLTMKTCISAYTLCHAVPCVQLLLTYSCGTFFFPPCYRHPWCFSLSHLPPCYASVKSAHWSSHSLCMRHLQSTNIHRINESYTPNKTGGYFQPEPKQQPFSGAIQVIKTVFRATVWGAE